MSKEDLLTEPAGTTDCPYVEVGVPVRAHNSGSNQPQVKRLKVENLMGKQSSFYVLHFLNVFLCFFLLLNYA